MRISLIFDWRLFLFGVTWGLEIPAVVGAGKFSACILHVGPMGIVFKRPLK